MFYEITELEKIDCLEITTFKLINNYGYRFIKNGFKYNLFHIQKEHGESVDYWTVYNKNFKTFEDAIDYIKYL